LVLVWVYHTLLWFLAETVQQDTTSLEDVAQIFGGNSVETTSAAGVLGFSTKALSGVLTERYRVENTGVHTWSNVGGVAGTAMTLNATGLGVGDAPASNTRLTVAAASRLADTTGQAYIRSTDAQAQDIGAQLTLGGLFNASAHYAFGGIAGRKENSTSGNVAGYLDFLTTTSGGSLTSRMRIDSTGNVGIGVTPSARFHSKAGAVTQGGIIETSGANALLSFADAGTSSYTRVQIGSSGNNLVAFINSVQAMTLDASGNLGIGVTPSVSKLHVGITSTATSGLAEANALKIENNNATVNNAAGLFLSQTGDAGCGIAGIATSRTGGSRTSALALYYYNQATSASPIEGARLDASGNLLVGTTSQNGSWNTKLTLSNDSGTTKWAVGPYLGGVTNFLISAGASAGVYLNGTAATSWTSASDERLKDIIEPITNAHLESRFIASGHRKVQVRREQHA